MFKLTALLCAAMFMALLIGGEDRGQLRPGLAKAAAQAEQRMTIATMDAPADQPTPAATATSTPLAADLAQPVVLPVMQPAATQDDAVAEAVALAVSDNTVTPENPIWHVTARSVNVRSGPGTDSPVVGRVTRGEAVSLVWMEDNGWARILIEGDGIAGYVSTDFLAEGAR